MSYLLIFVNALIIIISATFVCRDCIRFAFMDIIEMELNEVCDMWNNHLIAYTRRGNIDGIPEELYYLSEMRGNVVTYTT